MQRIKKFKFDYGRLRLYLRNALGVKKAFLFIGYIPRNAELYNSLQTAGFTLVFKPTVMHLEKKRLTTKGNVDAELVLYSAAIEYKNYDKAVIVSGDGDFACLAEYLKKNDKLEKIVTPTAKYSKLLKPYNNFILPLKDIRESIHPAAEKTER